MEKIKELTTPQILYNVARQKKWLEHYKQTDPNGSTITTIEQILNDLYKELSVRGMKCTR